MDLKYSYDDIKDTHTSILPVPFPDKVAPSAPEGINYGKAPYAMPLQPYPNSKYDKVQYCNQLPPAPRSQQLNVPYQGPECPFYNETPYTKDKCYLTTSNGQGVVGLVCNDAGGSDNSNFARGNQFGLAYKQLPPQSKQFKKKQEIYKVVPPVQTADGEFFGTKRTESDIEFVKTVPGKNSIQPQNNMIKQPEVIFDKNTFYPQPDWDIQQNKNYQTYMEPQRFTANGLPTYVYPYEVMNPMKALTAQEYEEKQNKRESTNDPIIGDFPKNVPYPEFNPDIQLKPLPNVTMFDTGVDKSWGEFKNLEKFENKCSSIQNIENFENDDLVNGSKSILVKTEEEKKNDFTKPEEFINMYCPHRGGCPFCKQCPYGPNCKCSNNCPYCKNCPYIKSLTVDNFTNNVIEGFENENRFNFIKFIALIVSIILIFLIIKYINHHFKG